MIISARIESRFSIHKVTVQTNESAKELELPVKPGGYGSSVNGGELLLLSLATCFCNDIYREAGKRHLSISSVEVVFTGKFGTDGEPGSDFMYKAKVLSDAPAAQIDELIRYTDSIAEVHNTLRKGLKITLTS